LSQHALLGLASALPTAQYDRHASTAVRSTPQIFIPPAAVTATATISTATSAAAFPTFLPPAIVSTRLIDDLP
jgi:hypothetical protein